MESRIVTLRPKKLVGIHMEMSLSDNKTQQLWQQFMPRRSEVLDRTSSEFLSMQVYTDSRQLFESTALFTKWAVVEVATHAEIPRGMDAYTLDGGKYVVFIHEGPASAAPKTWRYISGSWLPTSKYELDDREHFEVLPEDYNPLDPEAREEVWVPIKTKLKPM